MKININSYTNSSESGNYYKPLSATTMILIILLLLVQAHKSQTLLSLFQSASGSVSPVIEPTLEMNPCSPNFRNNSKKDKSPQCNDSVYIRSWSRWNLGEKVTPETGTVLCTETVNFSDRYIFLQYKWPNTTDLINILETSGCGRWKQVDDTTWLYHCSEHRYVCGNDSRGHTYTVDQIWKLDLNNRVKEIVEKNRQDQISFRIEFFYDRMGRVTGRTITTFEPDYYHDSYHKNFYFQIHTEWFYDSKQRLKMMIKYAGEHRKISSKQLLSYGINLARYVRNDTVRPALSLQSQNVRELVSYEYGRFGLETVNYYSQEVSNELNPHYYPPRLVSDSLFYDKQGRIKGYLCRKTWAGHSNEVRYSYEKRTGRLSTVVARHTPESFERGAKEIRILEWYKYQADGRVGYMKKQRFERHHQTPITKEVPDSEPESESETWYRWP